MSFREPPRWTPSPSDTGQALECSRARAVLKLFGGGISEDERCHRAFRAVELERVAAETRRAALAVLADLDDPRDQGDEQVRRQVLGGRLAVTIAALNLMGIPTVLPGEEPFDTRADMLAGTRIPLRGPTSPAERPGGADSIDALSGLIGDFRRFTIFINGLRIEPVAPHGDMFVLVAAHAAIMDAFGEFLAGKYVIEGWTLG